MDDEKEHTLVVESETEFSEDDEDSELRSADETDTDRYCESHAEVRVVIVPYSRSSKPTPSSAFRDAVQDHLDQHRLLTDRVTVERPGYVEVTVDVEVRLESDFGISELEDAVETALDDFLDPLHGFDGEGWPFGRTLYRSELYEVVEGVSGVDCVTRLTIQAPSDKATDSYGNVLLDETELFAPGDHTVTAQIATGTDRCGGGK